MQIRNILQKKPFYRIAPPWSDMVGITDNILNAPPVSDRTQYIIRTQIDFLREYDIAGHKINSRYIYPDKVSTDENGNKSIHPIARVAVAFQQEIVKKHLTYLCGNDIEFSMPISNPNESDENQRSEFKSAWVEKNMETAFYASMKADKITGDCAFCGILNKGKFQWRVFSFLDGDTLYPHYDSITGELSLFARKYSQLDDKGKEICEYLDVWDEKNIYHYKKDSSTLGKKIKNAVLEAIGLDGWKQIGAAEQHGFERVPVSYHRSGAPCWDASQDNIEAYEWALSQLAENNKAYALRILFLKGAEMDMKATVDGTPLSIDTADPDGEARFLEPADSSSSFELQLKTLENNIYKGSLVSKTPDIKGSDVSGIVVKMLFSDSFQQAFIDSQEYNSFIKDMIDIFKYGYGVEMSEVTKYKSLKINGAIVPYMYMSETEEVSNIVQLVSVGALSKRSASEHAHRIGYGVNGEWVRKMQEERETLIGNAQTIDKNVVSKTRQQLQQ